MFLLNPFWFAVILSSFSCVHRFFLLVVTFLEFTSKTYWIHWSKICRISFKKNFFFGKNLNYIWSEFPESHLISTLFKGYHWPSHGNLLDYCFNPQSWISLLLLFFKHKTDLNVFHIKDTFDDKGHSLGHDSSNYFGKPSDKKISRSSKKPLSLESTTLT